MIFNFILPFCELPAYCYEFYSFLKYKLVLRRQRDIKRDGDDEKNVLRTFCDSSLKTLFLFLLMFAIKIFILHSTQFQYLCLSLSPLSNF